MYFTSIPKPLQVIMHAQQAVIREFTTGTVLWTLVVDFIKLIFPLKCVSITVRVRGVDLFSSDLGEGVELFPNDLGRVDLFSSQKP